MTNVVPIALTVDPNEKVWQFCETTKQSPGSRGFHRYELMSVVRGGELAVFERDMGKASLYKGAKRLWMMPSLFEHTVDECRWYAERYRWEDPIDVKDFLQLDTYKVA